MGEGMRVGVDRNKYQIHIPLPPKIDPTVTMMQVEEKPDVTYSDVGGCKEQIEKLREVVETPLLHPEKFVNLGIDPPKGVLLLDPLAPERRCVLEQWLTGQMPASSELLVQSSCRSTSEKELEWYVRYSRWRERRKRASSSSMKLTLSGVPDLMMELVVITRYREPCWS